jgi:hypothetical protein
VGFWWDICSIIYTKFSKVLIITGGPPGSRSRHLGIKSPLLFPMS